MFLYLVFPFGQYWQWDVSILGASARQEFNIEVGNDSSAYISMLHIEVLTYYNHEFFPLCMCVDAS